MTTGRWYILAGWLEASRAMLSLLLLSTSLLGCQAMDCSRSNTHSYSSFSFAWFSTAKCNLSWTTIIFEANLCMDKSLIIFIMFATHFSNNQLAIPILRFVHTHKYNVLFKAKTYCPRMGTFSIHPSASIHLCMKIHKSVHEWPSPWTLFKTVTVEPPWPGQRSLSDEYPQVPDVEPVSRRGVLQGIPTGQNQKGKVDI